MKQKKQYQKPKMDIYYLTHQSQLLAGSGDQANQLETYEGEEWL